MCLITTIVLM